VIHTRNKTDWVDAVLSRAKEKYDRCYELVAQGHDLSAIIQRVAEIYDMEPDAVTSKGRQKKQGCSEGAFFTSGRYMR
jgi:hypothetical protein